MHRKPLCNLRRNRVRPINSGSQPSRGNRQEIHLEAIRSLRRCPRFGPIERPEGLDCISRPAGEGSSATGRNVVAWTDNFVHVRALSAQNAIRNDVRNRSNAAMGGKHALLKLEQFLPYRLNVVATLVSQALSRVYASRYRIGVAEWRVLVTLGQFGILTGKAISAHTHMHKTKVSRAVALLEKRKLLTRRTNRADMRESLLSLTPSGRTIYEELAPPALDFARRLTDILTPADYDAFHRALAQITRRSAELIAEAVEHDSAMGEM